MGAITILTDTQGLFHNAVGFFSFTIPDVTVGGKTLKRLKIITKKIPCVFVSINIVAS